MGKKDEDEGEEEARSHDAAKNLGSPSKIPNKIKSTEAQVPFGTINSSAGGPAKYKVDLKAIKNMSLSEQKEKGLIQIDSDGNQIKLSAYKQKKLLMQQAALQAQQQAAAAANSASTGGHDSELLKRRADQKSEASDGG